MKVSCKWLNRFVKVDDISPEELAEKLTFAGVEVEEVTHLAEASGLVIGEIKSCKPHPNSDHLHILEVDEGPSFGVHQIVCGAPNARVGLKTIVARNGAKLPGIVIAPSVIRGEASDGMCCSLKELGVDPKFLSEKQISGIEELPDDAKVGEEDVLGYLGLDDAILDLKLLANRSDLNAMENVAYEVGALLEREVKIPEYADPCSKESAFRVSSLTKMAPAFGARIIHGVKTKPSPKWLSEILRAEGVRSINNVVDIGNFVMLLTGQPLNMYDEDKLPEPSLVVRDDYEGEYLAMDEKRYDLKKGDLLVMSGGEPMCLAGLMTSKACEVDEKTTNVVIESAAFNGASIRHTSNRLGLVSESSSRFVKGLNPDQNERVLRIASALMVELCEANEVLAVKPYDTRKHAERVISTSLQALNARLGTSLTLEEVLHTLRRDHLEIVNQAGASFDVRVPSYRIDIDGEADISEEVIRLLGFERVPSSLPKSEHSLKGGYDEKQKNLRSIRRFLRDNGLDETLTYSLIGEKEKGAFCYLNDGKNIQIVNPMTDDHKYLRISLLPSLLNIASYNYSHQEKDLALFEISDIDGEGFASRRLAIVLLGEERLQGKLCARPYDFYSVKGYLEGIVSLLGLSMNRFKIEPLCPKEDEFHPYRSASLLLGKDRVAVFGELHPNALKKWGLGKGPCALLELDLALLLSLKASAPKAAVPPRFPATKRDLAVVIPKTVSFSDLKRETARVDRLIRNVDVFDVYEGEGIGSSKKSVALSLTFLDDGKTLKDEEVNIIMQKVRDALGVKFGAEVRS